MNTAGAATGALPGVTPNTGPPTTGAGGSGAAADDGVSSPVHRNRSSSSARAEYLSPADMGGGGAAEAAGAGGCWPPVLAFLIGGRVTELATAAEAGGWVRGSERLLVTSAHGTGSLVGVVTTQLAARSSVQSRMPRRRDVSEGSSGGKEERGARNGFVQVLETGGSTGAVEEERNGLKDFLQELAGLKGLPLSEGLRVGRLAYEALLLSGGGLGGGDLGLGGRFGSTAEEPDMVLRFRVLWKGLAGVLGGSGGGTGLGGPENGPYSVFGDLGGWKYGLVRGSDFEGELKLIIEDPRCCPLLSRARLLGGGLSLLGPLLWTGGAMVLSPPGVSGGMDTDNTGHTASNKVELGLAELLNKRVTSTELAER